MNPWMLLLVVVGLFAVIVGFKGQSKIDNVIAGVTGRQYGSSSLQ